MSEPGIFPEGYSVDAVDWLPSGARSGLVRVRGHRPPAVAGPLPELILETGGETRRFVSLPDPRADRDPSAWRGAYVLDAKPAAEADKMWLEWPGQRRIPLPALDVPAHQVHVAEEPEEPGGQLVDRAVLAERRARRAEAAEQAQARIAKEAMRAVEVLELRVSELERDTPGESLAAPDPRVQELENEIRVLRERLARAEAAPAPVVAPAPVDDRRAARLRAALTATVATVAELRLRLHESEVARRTRDVARAADAVKLAGLERERAAIGAALELARAELTALQGVTEENRDLTEQLAAARERIADLEAQLAAAEAVEPEEVDTSELEERLHRAETALAEAETARELAEATAMAAIARQQAAAVRQAAEEPPSAPPEPTPSMPAVSSLADAAKRQQERAEAAAKPDEDLAANLEAAQLKIVTESEHPPADVARGRGGRDYPPLRGALVKLAHDDPRAAGRLLAGLLRAQHAVVDDLPDYDITIDEVGTFAVSRAGQTTLVSPIDAPRGRPHARFHLHGDALTLAETLAGVENRAGRWRGPLRASGRVRDARRLTEAGFDASLEQLVWAGAELDPELVLRALAYAIRPAWTQGQVWAVEIVVGDQPVTVSARHSGGLTVGEADGEPDARMIVSPDAFRELVAGAQPPMRIEGDAATVRRLLSLAERARAGTP